MEVVLGFLVLAGIVCAVLLWQKATGAASSRLNQKVLDRQGHERGRKIVSTRLMFASSRLGPEALLQQILGYLALPKEAPRMVGSSYIAGVSKTEAIISIGSKFSSSAQLLLKLQSDDSGAGSAGSIAVASWTESDGIVASYQEMERLFGLVRQAVLHADSGATVRESVTAKPA